MGGGVGWLLPVCLQAFVHPRAFTNYISFKGTKQGQLKGKEKGKSGKEDLGLFNLHSFEFGTESPVAKGSGSSKGKVTHGSVVITKEEDGASLLLLQANNDHEVFENVTIQSVDAAGHVASTTVLGNAVLTGIKKDGAVETLSFNYETFTKG